MTRNYVYSYLNLDKSIKCIYLYLGKNAKLPGYMDYLHLSTSDVGNLKESWSVLEDNVSKVKLLSKLINIIDQKSWVFATNSDFLITLHSAVRCRRPLTDQIFKISKWASECKDKVIKKFDYVAKLNFFIDLLID